MNLKKKMILTIIFALSVLAAIIVLSFGTQRVVSTINGYAITKEEVDFHKRIHRNEVRNYYLSNYGIALEDKDWTRTVGDETPEEFLYKTALKECRYNKAVFILAYEKGIIEYVDFRHFKMALKDENAKRKKAIEAGETVYGMTTFSEEEYYSHVLSDLKNALVEEMSISDEDVARYLEGNSDQWLFDVTTYSAEDIRLDENEQEITKDILLFTSDSYSTDMRKCPEARLLVGKMDLGEVAYYKDGTGDLHSIKLVEKQVDRSAAFAKYYSRAKRELAVSRLDETIRAML